MTTDRLDVQAPAPSRERLAEVFSRLRTRVQERYGVPVRLVALAPPFIGDLDGGEILISEDQDPELALFNLVHLFGHTVQWSLAGRVPDVGTKAPGAYSEGELLAVAAYERDASRYGLALLRETGVNDLDQWLADVSAADAAYLLHFYRTGEKRSPMDFRRRGRPPLAPLPIPVFTPRRLRFRSAGVVI